MEDIQNNVEEGQVRPEIGFLSTAIDGVADPLDGLVQDAEGRGFVVSSQTVPQGRLLASLEWTELTAFALFFFSPVYNEFYNWMKDRIPRLWREFFDADAADRIRVAKVSARGILPQDYSLTFSVWATFRFGRVKLVFREECSEAVMQQSIEAFASLMLAYGRGETYDDVDLNNETDCYYGVIVVNYAEEERRLRVLNPYSKLQPEALETLRRSERERRMEGGGPRIEPWIGESRQPKQDD